MTRILSPIYYLATCLCAVVLCNYAQASDTPDYVEIAKTRLQEALQKTGLNLPEYEVADVDGADHERVFRVTCAVPQRGLSVDAKGRSRRRAEQRAAAAMLEQLDHA